MESRPMNSDVDSDVRKRWDQTCDVLVVGSGFAGLAAAIEARSAGRSVIVIEKMRGYGGNSTICGGCIAAPGTPMQRARGIQDSAEQMYADMMAAGLGLNHPDLVRTVTENAAHVFQWTVETLGVRYKDRVDPFGGHSVPRGYTTHNRSGSAIVRQLLAKALELEIPIRTRHYLQRLVCDPDGRVSGAVIRQGFRHPDVRSGTPLRIGAHRAVVLATGGFACDVRFREAHDPRLDASVDATTKHSTTGEALKAAMRLGALPVHLSWIQLGPWACPDEKGYGIGPDFAYSVALPHGILVDPKTGMRFVNEMADRRTRVDAMFSRGAPSVAIADAAGVKCSGYRMERCLKKGIVRGFESLTALATHYTLPAETLMTTIARYNQSVSAGRDEAFGKPIFDRTGIIDTPPYYAIRLWPKVHYTMGGLMITPEARVLDLSMSPINGFFAAGEVTGGIHGACRLGCCSITECLVFGRIAGRNAAEEPSRCDRG